MESFNISWFFSIQDEFRTGTEITQQCSAVSELVQEAKWGEHSRYHYYKVRRMKRLMVRRLKINHICESLYRIPKVHCFFRSRDRRYGQNLPTGVSFVQ